MNNSPQHFILGSRSPRRKELLAYLVPENNISIVPPASAEEKSFSELSSWDEITNRVLEISLDKMNDVFEQVVVREKFTDFAVLTADTVVVVKEKMAEKEGEPDCFSVLGQPPEGPDWKTTVQEWFEKYYLDQDHFVVTAFSLQDSRNRRITKTVTTTVRFRADSLEYLDWYLSTEESIGKAGGYGIQGKGSIFVDRLEGSLSNVIGLPLNELSQAIKEINSSS
jgi:nucleoside triphosphate pyrophosphatase